MVHAAAAARKLEVFADMRFMRYYRRFQKARKVSAIITAKAAIIVLAAAAAGIPKAILSLLSVTVCPCAKTTCHKYSTRKQK